MRINIEKTRSFSFLILVAILDCKHLEVEDQNFHLINITRT